MRNEINKYVPVYALNKKHIISWVWDRHKHIKESKNLKFEDEDWDKDYLSEEERDVYCHW